MADDPLTAALEKIRERHRFVTTPAVWADRAGKALAAQADLDRDDVPRLLAALDAVLAEHTLCDCCDGETKWCKGCDFTWPCATVQAITRALAGEGDDGR